MKKSMKVVLVVLLLGQGFAGRSAASPTSIGIFFSEDGTDCDATVLPNVPFECYIMATLGTDEGRAGITGAEFSAVGFRPEWAPVVTANPAANIAIGNPIAGGSNIAFPVCQPVSPVLLYTVRCTSAVPIAPTTLWIDRHRCPCQEIWAPIVSLCDAGVWTPFNVPGGQAFLNGPSCTVAVNQSTWSSIKGIYR